MFTRITLFVFLFSADLMAQSGFQYLYTPNFNQYDHLSFYVNGPKMICGGFYPSGGKSIGSLIIADTSGTLLSSWACDESTSGYDLKNIRKVDANNAVITGRYNGFPTAAMIAKVNYTTGTSAFCKSYSSNAAFGDGFSGNDAIKLSNGDFALTGNINIDLSGGSSPMHTCAAPDAYGYLKAWFGTSSYKSSDGIGLIRTDGNGDSLWAKQYNLAYDGNGTFGFPCPTPTWACDSPRADVPAKIIEVGTNMFITGYTVDYNRVCGIPNSNYDYQAFVMKVNASGTLQWCKTYFIAVTLPNVPKEYGLDMAVVTSDATNDIIVTMRSDNSGNVELFRVQNGTGNLVWAKSYNCGASARAFSIKATSDGNFIVGITSTIGAIGSDDAILLKVDRNGSVLNKKGVGTIHSDGTDSWAWYGPNVDEFSLGTYAIACESNYSGGLNCSSYVSKINNQNFTSGCSANQFNVTITVTDRNSGGANQLSSRTPVVYETRNATIIKTALTMNVSSITASVSPAVICILPVEFLSFSGTIISREQVLLNWATASEQNNNYFTIERSSDAKEFFSLGNVAGAGNSSTTLSYEFVDNELPPATAAATLYYRLKQTDYNGKFTYTQIISVQQADNEMVSVSVDEKEQMANFVFILNNAEKVFLDVYDILGNKLFSKEISSSKGYNKFSVPLTNFSNGSYLASFSFSGMRVNKKFMINCKHD